MTKELTAMVEAFLKDRRQSEGGYAKVTDQDINDLYAIVYKLVEEKCEPDPDGDRPIDVKLVDRTKFEPIHYCPVPYRHKAKTEEEKYMIFEVAMLNLSIATERVNCIMKQMQFDKHNKK